VGGVMRANVAELENQLPATFQAEHDRPAPWGCAREVGHVANRAP
jgi:hypothetical protein